MAEEFESIEPWVEYFKDYALENFFLGGSGADIGPLKDGRVILSGLRPDPQRYFDYHHAPSDTFDKINMCFDINYTDILAERTGYELYLFL